MTIEAAAKHELMDGKQLVWIVCSIFVCL
jgi:hypothetical protein